MCNGGYGSERGCGGGSWGGSTAVWKDSSSESASAAEGGSGAVVESSSESSSQKRVEPTRAVEAGVTSAAGALVADAARGGVREWVCVGVGAEATVGSGGGLGGRRRGWVQ